LGVRWFWITVRTLVAALVVLQALPVSQVSADELIVTQADASVQVSGPWQSVSDTGSSSYLERSAGSGGATVFWPFPSSLASGQYQLFARWTSGPDRASSATYFVSSSNGTQSVSENQQTNGGSWQLLGSYSFQPGQGNGVTLTDSSSGVVIADAVRWVPMGTTAQPTPTPGASTAATSPSPTPTPAIAQAAAPTDPNAVWTVTLGSTELHAGPDASTDKLASLTQFAYLQVLGYSGDWAYVYNPRARGTAYVQSEAIGPSDPPPAWVTAPPPTPIASVEMMGRSVGSARVAFYPVDDRFAYTTSLGHDVPILVHDKVQAADGSIWYRIDSGYLPASAVRLPRPPTASYSGRWLDADLQEPAMLTAYDGNRLVMDTLAIKGTIANQTPTGTFRILRRVQDETMDSGTLGIDPHGPGGYHLEHVLNTQYFTNDGASIHYNYWSSNFGYSGSHGCLGLDLQDSTFLWTWADVGTPVVIRN
jgi:lipoprotein-anchoring transpeptidase ErfK/SrfK